jgi:hypothetical protein
MCTASLRRESARLPRHGLAAPALTALVLTALGIAGVTASRLIDGGGATSERVSGSWKPWKTLHGPSGPNAFGIRANGVNRCGDIIGLYRGNSLYEHAALWKHAWCDARGRPEPEGQ